MYTVLIVFHVLLAAALIAVVLVQRGPGATMGAAFGSGASGTVFGSRGAAGFLTKLTSWLGVAFFAVSLTMAVMVARSGNVGGQSEDLGVAGQLAQPAAEEQAEGEQASSEAASEAESSDEEFLEVPVEEEETEDESEQPPRVD
ncbi:MULTISPECIES: preprotein translocase subunit SecG [unclassified Wenzhouxiangella]|uniref:preprotein translocase subunit SecG n=1 Tax=unclassified Wenzhouxiangella TaxID=2613841 RepID=UPI000E328F29|nr:MULTISPECIES: preprotein translocase subunit SecG [unclassified Wenzhouxiangella]RFF28436.1 preprotein translocase subunit SecG [Wenzhouxiangella sp. 15181]RFP69953.1 preprotein translocase subunit SecG [Wenzhouxiangella sp. 15190]